MPTPAPPAARNEDQADHPARRALDALLRPRRIAIVGATNEKHSVAHVLAHHLRTHARDAVVAVLPTPAADAQLPTYPSLASVPHAVDLALVATPAALLPGVLHDCTSAGVALAVIFAQGAAALAQARAALTPPLLQHTRQHGLRLLGPTSFGLQRPPAGLNAAIVGAMAQRGSVAFVSQSDALCRAVLDWSKSENVGFSAFVSLGAMLDVGWGDVLDILGDDFHTDSIVLHMDAVGDTRALVSAARDVALRKPIIVLKTPAAAAPQPAHVDDLFVSSDDVFDAVARRCGMVRVDTVADLFNMAALLGKQPRPLGPRLAIITNAGGPGQLAADTLLRSGCEPITTAPTTQPDAALPVQSPQSVFFDLGDDASPAHYHAALDALAKGRNADGVLVICAPHPTADPHAIALQLVPFAKMTGMPLLASWMGGDTVRSATALLNRAGIPTFAYPDTAARMFSTLWHCSSHLRSLYETPTLALDEHAAARDQVASIIEHARRAGRAWLTAEEARDVLAAYGISPAPLSAADRTATNYPLRLGSTVDAQFGPVLVLGIGGPWAARGTPIVGVPPLTTTLARRMIEQLPTAQVRTGSTSPLPFDTTAWEQLLVRFSLLVVEHPWVKTICIDPLLLTPAQLVALHADMGLHGGYVSTDQLPQPVIRPYPTQYAGQWTLPNGTPVTIRPIRPEDEPLLARFHATLSARSVLLRYFAPLTLSRRTEHERLTRICFIDYDREMALVTERTDPATGERSILAVGRLARLFGTSTAEFALLISDQAQNQGLGTELLRRLVVVGRAEGVHEIIAQILPENRVMQHVAEKQGFRLRRILHDNVVFAQLDLAPQRH